MPFPQVLIAIINVGPLAANASVVIDTGIREESGPRAPLFIMPDRATPISVIGDPHVTDLVSTVTFQNLGGATESATFFCWREHTIIDPESSPGVYWRGLGAAVPSVPVTEAMFYGLTAGTGNGGATDYAATVAVNAPVPFPRLGPLVGSGIIPGGTNQFVLPATGVYEVSWAIDFLEASQLLIKLGAVEQPSTCTMSGAGTQQNCNRVLIAATAGDLLSLCNASGNAAALTVQTADGSRTHAQAPSLCIRRVS